MSRGWAAGGGIRRRKMPRCQCAPPSRCSELSRSDIVCGRSHGWRPCSPSSEQGEEQDRQLHLRSARSRPSCPTRHYVCWGKAGLRSDITSYILLTHRPFTASEGKEQQPVREY
ncbi:Hypothetical predicted protein [Pelobates cultripes]|uniref:Uncharacterized protein n=1 Tax=Pelobates cultripes TaxID=61616 RepID=A0AAD1VRZ2_PELCU|nr:Hypothetical predicted protein [Pelobates cultripes]